MIDSFRGKYFFLSNFYEVPVSYSGETYQNNESAFQAQKCYCIKDRRKFYDLTPSEAKRMGKTVSLRTDWELVKTDFMYDICKEKFLQNEDLKEKLLETGDEELQEGNTWGDKIWGTVNGVGQNRLGKILMELREKFRK